VEVHLFTIEHRSGQHDLMSDPVKVAELPDKTPPNAICWNSRYFFLSTIGLNNPHQSYLIYMEGTVRQIT
jgi:hypothetical protein